VNAGPGIVAAFLAGHLFYTVLFFRSAAGRLINITLYFLAQYLIIAAARRIWPLPARPIT